MALYRLTSPISGLLDKPGDEHVLVALPTGAEVRTTEQRSTTLIGMVGVYWEGRHYSVYPRDLAQKAERVS